MKKRILAIGVTIAVALGCVSCGGSGTTPTSEENKNASSKVLNVHLDVEVASMDPQIATDGTSFEVLAAVTEGLYSIDESGTPILAMAESVDKSEDGLIYTFQLRDAKWSNGTAVTANDFVFAWRRLVNPAVASEYAFIAEIAGITNAAKIAAGEAEVDTLGVKAVNDKTLQVTLDTPVPFFESLMAFPSFLPVNEEFYNTCGDTYATSPETILANGPFVLTSYEPATTSIQAEKNGNYWDADKVALSGIKWQVIKDSQQAMLSYQNGDLDVATLSGEQVEQF